MNVKTLFYAVAFLSLSWASFTYAQDVLPEYTQARRFAPSNAEQLLFSYTPVSYTHLTLPTNREV